MPAKLAYSEYPKWVSAIETSTTYKTALAKLDITHHNYDLIHRVEYETNAHLMPRVFKGLKPWYGPYYEKENSLGYVVLTNPKQKLSVRKAILCGILIPNKTQTLTYYGPYYTRSWEGGFIILDRTLKRMSLDEARHRNIVAEQQELVAV